MATTPFVIDYVATGVRYDWMTGSCIRAMYVVLNRSIVLDCYIL